ncbi:cytochrome P450 [Microbaculum marinum]|uniref:Cytochrome P450 n=1 Tax=Microbaculum marinum TaxID=1764581 RepID=A0AAW9RFI5_9HYPH
MNRHITADTAALPFIDLSALAEEPHAAFAALRKEHAIIQVGERQYMALRAHDVLAMLGDPRTIQVEGPDYVELNGIPDGVVARFLKDIFLFGNGDAHRAKRGLFARTFAHGAIREARPRIRAVADAIVADLPRSESFDFIERMAARVPAEMIAAILGLPGSEVPYFTRHACTVARALTPVYPHRHHREIEDAALHLSTYVEEHMLARMVEPRDDVLSKLVADWRSNQVIPFPSLVHQVLGIILGGSDTTRAAFAMLVALLVQHPRQWRLVKDDQALIPGAVAEALRYEPSVGSVARFTTAPVEVGGVLLPAGVMLRVSTMSAMRDPALYADPDRFDIRRCDHPRMHPVFGAGPHRCIGEMLARLEMQEGLDALVCAVREIEIETHPRMTGCGGIRQISPMRVRIR